MTKIALTRAVPATIAKCELTHLARQPIDFERASAQHESYERALEDLGCTIHRLPTLDDMPDSVFVEDTAVTLPEIAIIARPGAESRRGETASVATTLRAYRRLATIEEPATLDGGDVLVIGKRIVVGRTARTNDAGIEQLRALVGPFGYRVDATPVEKCLHLKSAATRIGDTVLLNRDWVDAALFSDVIDVDPLEPHAANALEVDGGVLLPADYPRTRARVTRRGFVVKSIEADELAKAEGGLTCGSLILES